MIKKIFDGMKMVVFHAFLLFYHSSFAVKMKVRRICIFDALMEMLKRL